MPTVDALAYGSGAVLGLWGTAHLVPTRSVAWSGICPFVLTSAAALLVLAAVL